MSCAKSWVGLSLHLTLLRWLLLLLLLASLFQENHNHTHNQGEFTLLRLHFRIFTFCFTALFGVRCGDLFQPGVYVVTCGPRVLSATHSLSLSGRYHFLSFVFRVLVLRKSVIRVVVRLCVCVCAPQTQKMFTLFTPLTPGWTTFYCPFDALSPPGERNRVQISRTFLLPELNFPKLAATAADVDTTNWASPQKPTTTTTD